MRALIQRAIVGATTLAAAAAVAFLQPALSERIKRVRLGDDTTALPPPKQLRAMTLGYHAAAADILWAATVVQHGIYSHEKRAFRGITRYFDAILELEPTHPILFKFIDTLMLYRPAEIGTPEDARATRKYFEFGTAQRPYDADVWLHYGQFLAFLAPSFLTDPQEIERWRTDGALAMSRAIELGALPDRGLSVSSLLGKAGETRAAIRQLERTYALTDDPDVREQALRKLQRLQANLDIEQSVSAVEREWRAHVPFVPRSTALLLGPYRDPALCAGGANTASPRCARDWSALVEAR
jgi:hypothetical protein